jgi:hypothetical protein
LLGVVLPLQLDSSRPRWRPEAALPWHRQRYGVGRPEPDDVLLRRVLDLPTPARCFAGAAQVALLPHQAWPTSHGFARAVCPDPSQGLGPQLAPVGCQREYHVVAAVEGHELETPEAEHRPGLKRLLKTTHLEINGKLFVNTQQAPTWRANCRCFEPGGPWTDE